jgi:hypothetical protein
MVKILNGHKILSQEAAQEEIWMATFIDHTITLPSFFKIWWQACYNATFWLILRGMIH